MLIYKFRPYLKSVIWGGEKLKEYKRIDTDQAKIGESWEISGVPGLESVVVGGPDDGLTLPQLVDKYREHLVGKWSYDTFGSEFPLLVKFIDACRDLSVQVHPNDELAMRRHGSRGKTEMWYLIGTEPGAKIYCGLSRHITPDQYMQIATDGTIMDYVVEHEARPGDIFFLPAGRIHAIGAGCLLAEIQQTSDITYRIHDYGRLDADGRPRQLHTELAKDAIDYTVYPSYRIEYERDSAEELQVINGPYFDIARLALNGSMPLHHTPASFTIVICMEGECRLVIDGDQTTLASGETALVPAAATGLRATGRALLLTTRI